MCLTGGCLNANDDHGDSRNITVDDIKTATKTIHAIDLTPEEAMRNLVEGWETYVDPVARQTLDTSDELLEGEELYHHKTA